MLIVSFCAAGLLLLAKKNVYIIDAFFQKQNGELVDAWDAPAEVGLGEISLHSIRD